MCDQIRSAALLIDLKMEIAEKLLRTALCAALIEFDDWQGQWHHALDTPLGYKLKFDIPISTFCERGASIMLDVVFTQTHNGTIVLATYQAAQDLRSSILDEIYLKTQTAIETTMPLINEVQ